jgi:cell shape-determining protein MreC
LSLSALSLNLNSDAKEFLLQAINIVKCEEKTENKLSFFKEILYIFFRLQSLEEYYEKNSSKIEDVDMNRENKGDEEFHAQIISKTLFALHKFLRGK